MKKTFAIIFSLLLISVIALLCFRVYNKVQAKAIVEKNTATLPVFSFTAMNNTFFSDTNIEGANGKLIINFFNPDCEHCQYMASSFIKNKEKIQNTTIIMVTLADSTSVAKFYEDYKLSTMQNIVVLRDTKFDFYKIFGTAMVPSFFVYQNKRLLKKVIGETKIENLIN